MSMTNDPPLDSGLGLAEYFGEAGAYESGTRYCLPCGVVTWAVSPEGNRA